MIYNNIRLIIMYNKLGFKCLFEPFCPVPTFVTADSDDVRNPQRYICDRFRNLKNLNTSTNNHTFSKQS